MFKHYKITIDKPHQITDSTLLYSSQSPWQLTNDCFQTLIQTVFNVMQVLPIAVQCQCNCRNFYRNRYTEVHHIPSRALEKGVQSGVNERLANSIPFRPA